MKINVINRLKSQSVCDTVLLLLIAAMVIHPPTAAIFAILLFILSFVFSSKEKLQIQPKKLLVDGRFWLLTLFLMHLLGLLWTDNFRFAWADIGMKIYFILLPIIAWRGRFTLGYKQIEKWLVFSITALVIGCHIYAIYQSLYYEEDNHWGYFFESEFSPLMHRSYFATYCTIGTLVSVWLLQQAKSLSQKVRYTFTLVLLSMATFQSGSKAGILILFLAVFLIGLFYLLPKLKPLFKWFFALLFAFLVGYLFFGNSLISQRLQQIPKSLTGIELTNNTSTESNAGRVLVWYASLKLIKDKHLVFGAGTGDGKDELIKKNFELGNTGVAERKYNCHNQYLNFAIHLGVLGIVPVIMILFLGFKKFKSEKRLDVFLITLTFALTFLFESFLETQAGILPFSVFVCFYLSKKAQKSTQATKLGSKVLH